MLVVTRFFGFHTVVVAEFGCVGGNFVSDVLDLLVELGVCLGFGFKEGVLREYPDDALLLTLVLAIEFEHAIQLLHHHHVEDERLILAIRLELQYGKSDLQGLQRLDCPCLLLKVVLMEQDAVPLLEIAEESLALARLLRYH